MRARDWVFVFIPNQVTSVRNAESLKSQGLQPGFPDYLVFWPIRAAVELKIPGKRPRPEQFTWLRRLRAAGWVVMWGTKEEVIHAFEETQWLA